ncbi:VOC family protein [Streptomyces sp. LX-29]|uniref:VOC family protein n=1 Tax=Streptomyces sp. LX-29 TaxID=2900152 RepID=UPI00240D8893|nr:VOC family protein [Streptomyces sp. LX-29]WFB07017.1 VOC family protein [Streptomyces sp. LX-29]
MTEAPARCAPGTPCWTSLMVHSLNATQDFYHSLFGWEFRPGPQQLGAYVRATLDGQSVAGIGELPPERHLPIAWTTYLASDDADDTAEQIRSCGGTVAVGPLDAEEAGRMVIASDPSGAVFGVWQARAHLGAEREGVPGTPVWRELVTYETTTAGKFYQAVFGYEAEALVSADFDYVTLHLAGRPVAAVHGVGHGLPRDRGPHWMTYFEVEDADAATRRVTELGGQVLQPPRDGATGRLATVADPEGAVFTVVRTAR